VKGNLRGTSASTAFDLIFEVIITRTILLFLGRRDCVMHLFRISKREEEEEELAAGFSFLGDPILFDA